MCGREVLREHSAQIDPRFAADIVLDLRACHGLVPERLVQPPQDVAPLRVIVDDRANRVQHVPALGIHVPRALSVDAEYGHDGPVVADPAARADHVRSARHLPQPALGVNPLGVVREALVQPHVGVVLRRDAVAPPFVCALVHNDEIPLQAQSRARQVAAEIAVEVMVAIGDGALMLHAQVRRLHELVAIGVPRIRPEPVLKAPQHGNHLLELSPRGIGVIVERPEIECQPPRFAVQRIAEVSIPARVDRHVIVVDRARHEPFVRRRAV